MTPRAAMELKIPDLAGGLNLRDGLSEVLDNQLTDCKNMWWQDGLLKTRPGLFKIAEVATEGYDEKINLKQTDVYIGQYRLFFYNIWGTRKSETDDYKVDVFGETGFWLQGESEIIELPTLKSENVNFVCQKKNIVYAFCSDYTIWKLEFSTGSEIPEVENGWAEVLEEEYYVPTIYSHCILENGYVFSGTQFEGYNLIGNKFKMIYSTVNPNITPTMAYNDDGTQSVQYLHEMYYPFPDLMITNPEKYIGKEAKAIITNDKGEKVVHSAVFTDIVERNGKVCAEGWETSSNKTDGLKMCISTEDIVFWVDQGSGIMDPAHIYENDLYIEDNLEIIMPYIPTAEEKAKVFNMTQCTWFGGDAAGLSGGTRLFLCGNSGDEKALVMWSGLNNPLYFSENCYAYVGNENQAVTCFGKQAETLVIFKEKGAGSFYTSYVQNSDISASDLINQTVIDYTASNVYFPIIQLHSIQK